MMPMIGRLIDLANGAISRWKLRNCPVWQTAEARTSCGKVYALTFEAPTASYQLTYYSFSDLTRKVPITNSY